MPATGDFESQELELGLIEFTGAVVALSERIAMGPPLASTAFGS